MRIAAAVMLLLVFAGLGLLSHVAAADEFPLQLYADEVFISSDRTVVKAEGAVTAEFQDIRLSADALEVHQTSDEEWQFEASGDVRLSIEDGLKLSGDRLAAVVDANQGGTLPRSLEAANFQGESRFTNSLGEEHTFYFRGESGRITFDEAGEASLIEVHEAEVTTCDCCGLPFRSQPYTLRADRLQLYPDRLIVVFGLTARIAGVSSFWLPVYAQPLEETLESPLFPAFGRSGLRGWFLKWNVPFFLSESLYGSLLFDYYAAHDEIGTGLVARYAFSGHEGRFRVYRFPAKVGDSIFEFSASHDLPAGETWSGGGSVDYRVVGETTELDYGAQAQGSSGGWTVRVSAAREIEERGTDEEEEGDALAKVTERIPEISMSREPWTAGPVSVRPSLELGRYREVRGEEPAAEALRASASLGLRTDPQTIFGISFSPSLDLRGTVYQGTEIEQGRGSLRAGVRADWRNIGATYDLSLVQGGSPFEFDAEVATHHIGWDVSGRAWGRLSLSGGIDLSTGTLDPLRVRLTWADWANWTLSADYDVESAALDSVRLDGNWSEDALKLTWSIPYQASEARFGKIRATLDAPGEWLDLDVDAALDRGKLTVKTNFDADLSLDPFELSGNARFSNVELSGLSLSSTVLTAAGWGGKVAWTYSGGPLSLDTVCYGLFWDIGGCLRVGIDREAADTWFYLSILAFPEAIVRYAPAASRIETGN